MSSLVSSQQVQAPGRPGQFVGSVLGVNRSQATVQFEAGITEENRGATVGNFLGICKRSALLIGAVINVTKAAERDGRVLLTADVDLLGEVMDQDGEGYGFKRGITYYPAVGDAVRGLTAEDLAVIFAVPQTEAIQLGRLHQDPTIPAAVNVENLLSKHFAVLGTTGVGKSSGVALLLQRIAAAQTNLRTFLIDPHNEYGRCFGEAAQVLNPTNLKLPFWLFNFEEIVDVIFRGRPGVEEEVAILAEVIPLARAAYDAQPSTADGKMLRRPPARSGAFTVDTPLPYRLTDLITLIDERLGKLENRSLASRFIRLMSRIEAVRNDRRYGFMFDNANVGGDTMVDVVSSLFQLQSSGSSITVMQLAGFPTEVVDSVVSVVCRMAFDFGLWSDGAFPILFVCEEAHRYAPADRTVGFGPTRKALSRVAKEGRKYGVFLGLVSQRAGELDPTILSQCSTVFAMRMGNEQDQRIIRSSVSESAANLLGFLPTLATREVFAFGEGVALPLRFFFETLPAAMRPKGEALQSNAAPSAAATPREIVAAAVERWRGATLGPRKLVDLQAGDNDFEPGSFSARETAAPGGRSGFGSTVEQAEFGLRRSPLRRLG